MVAERDNARADIVLKPNMMPAGTTEQVGNERQLWDSVWEKNWLPLESTRAEQPVEIKLVWQLWQI